MLTKFVVGVLIFNFTLTMELRAAPPANVSLMGSLAEWSYPGSKFEGGSMSDGGNHLIQSINCQARLTTDDSCEKVAKYYSEKFVSKPEDREANLNGAEAQSVSTQDDSKDRPIELRVITVNRDDTATTLVVSRSKDEEKTHIAWAQYRRFGSK